MTESDVSWAIGYLLGAWAVGFGSGSLISAFRTAVNKI